MIYDIHMNLTLKLGINCVEDPLINRGYALKTKGVIQYGYILREDIKIPNKG